MGFCLCFKHSGKGISIVSKLNETLLIKCCARQHIVKDKHSCYLDLLLHVDSKKNAEEELDREIGNVSLRFPSVASNCETLLLSKPYL